LILFRTILYAVNQDGLWQITTNNNQPELLLKNFQANDFLIAGKNIYLIKESILIKGSLNNDSYQETKNITCSNCLIQGINNSKAILLNPNENRTIIVDLEGRLKNIEINANKIEWLNKNSLIVFDNFEIYLFELNKTEPEIITRLGSEIYSVIWHSRGRHLFFSTENKIKIIEMDNREFRNTTEIIEQPADHLALDRAGKNLYFSNSEGIFKLNIQ
jgi:ethanolamine utilization protein EutA (predicted chaperonin)